MISKKTLEYSKIDMIITLRLNRPKRNASKSNRKNSAIRRVEAEKKIRSIIYLALGSEKYEGLRKNTHG